MIGYLAQPPGRYDLPLPTGMPTATNRVFSSSCRTSTCSRRRGRCETTAVLPQPTKWCTPRCGRCRGYARLVRLRSTTCRTTRSTDGVRSGARRSDDPASLEVPRAERILGAMRSSAGRRRGAAAPHVGDGGYADNVTERVGRRLVPTFERIHEAMLRHRAEAASRALHRRAPRLEAERALQRMLPATAWSSAGSTGSTACGERVHAPHPNELEAPGLWLRIELPH
jgi:hypothetical protein